MQSILRTISIVLPVVLTGAQAMAQPAYPSKPVRFLVGAPAGGSNDIFARAISQRLSEALGQPVIVDNRPGASQMIAADLTAKAPADGHTLYITSTTYTTGVALMAKLPCMQRWIAASQNRPPSHRRHTEPFVYIHPLAQKGR